MRLHAPLRRTARAPSLNTDDFCSAFARSKYLEICTRWHARGAALALERAIQFRAPSRWIGRRLWPDRIQLPQFIGLFVSIDLNPFGELAPRGGQALVRATVDSAQPLFASAGRRAPTDSDGAETTRILFAWAKAAALQALLDQDSLAAATPIAGLSERGTRRLFERLAALGAIRELTGRATFRLYGL
jgi:hypothetical protein